MLSFSDDFPAPDPSLWRSLVEKGLRGAAFEERLVGRTEDGIRIPPLYLRADELPDAGLPGRFPFIRGGAASRPQWDIRSLCRLPDPVAANRAILADLAGGATSILLDGTALRPADLALALDGVMLDLAPVYLREPAGDVPAGVIALLDPIEAWAAGREAAPAVQGFTPTARIAVNGTVFDDGGASDAEEIGLTIAAVIDLARQMEDGGTSAEAALGAMLLQASTGVDFFAGIAKLRALRRLWSRVVEVAGVERPPLVHAVSSARMLTRYDRWTNLLRNTIACAAAAMGGADAITVLPHDHACGLPDAFAARLARNIQNVLQEESGLGLVTDPLGGSWYVEQLTEQLAGVAWAIVQRIEMAGGFREACEVGLVAEILQARQEARSRLVGTRACPIIGVSQFPDPGETKIPPRSDTARRRLPRWRDAEPFEALRDRSLAKGAVPVFVLLVGPAARHAARLGFATNLFAIAGLHCVIADAVNAFPQTGARLAVIAGADEDYADRAVSLAEGLRHVGAEDVHLLGKPSPLEGALREAGVSRFVVQGQDMAGYLSDIVERLT
ncbi:MAG TPA: methylmalonyl-CoA mutase family protein [Geminicoccus sp.]|uniref:methylmalonyl-CoA mutase family protein n=1 Tax=Geminicoccus sp. TaxID=2024832 RepID=UPI002E377003|nr:methylmalonyl-CoA mutase family protein [Geminicoccus sp.]HEX2525395.1 methylmalonyl-CoA mutase family protein [Geminicoccus sp.]